MHIRDYIDADWEAVREIYNLSKPDELKGSVDLRALIPLEKDRRNLRLFQQSRIMVVEKDSVLVGFGGYYGNTIHWLFVHPHHRRKGAARLILKHIVDQLTGTVKLNVFKNNRVARTLYQKFGFVKEREFLGNYNGYQSRAMTLHLERSDQWASGRSLPEKMKGGPNPEIRPASLPLIQTL
jgi:GNAT superfamily N-acetyltransferase